MKTALEAAQLASDYVVVNGYTCRPSRAYTPNKIVFNYGTYGRQSEVINGRNI